MALTNSQFDEINRKYDEKRILKAHELQKRKEEVRANVPGFNDIENEIISTSMDYSKLLLKSKLQPDSNNSSHDSLKEYHHKMDSLRKRKSDLLHEYGYEDDYLEMKHDCDKCEDTGYVNGQKCSCFVRMQVELLYEYSQMKEFLLANNFSKMSYDYYEGDALVRFKEAVDECKKFINNFNCDYHNLFFYGKVGTGKSFLSGCVAKELLDKGYSVLYVSSVNLFQTISNYIYSQDKSTYIRINDSLHDCDLLIIDDLGTELCNEFVRSHLFELINERLLCKKAMIISTNKTIEEFTNIYSDRVFSRVCENFELIPLYVTKDIRIQKKLEQSS